ncbi:alanine/glycine:cation symporter family protein [Gephyromycinifex aptenodytis]|uniref:alanine/glycine:cation symporter family protein n=1 Tax=Gephyromycinifex aptenodytis TaxID=2716227 RepID=UPI001D01865D|nr:alanine/glycine:cation symporter family protein [Gephyromycinifex aptenodytis]
MSDLLSAFEGAVSSYVLVYLLLAAGLYYTIRTRCVQVRLFAHMARLVIGSGGSGGARSSLSSFQALTIGLASRVGTGNIAGVALAVIIGGPGALFWMWIVAFLGMATSFVESTLGQIFKVPWKDDIYRGGPAYYMQRGLGARRTGVLFAVMLVFSYGIVFPMVQANTIASTLNSSHGVPVGITALVLMALTAPLLLRGMRVVAKVVQVLVPVMAMVYLLVAAAIILIQFAQLPRVLHDIFVGAFGLQPALAGTGGGLFATFLNGVKRGLFSNEAGQGSVPNGAATAEVDHPAQQGLVQAFGVFIDTILICSATGFVILLAPPAIYTPGVEPSFSNVTLVQMAIAEHLGGGGWVVWFMTFVVLTFAYSSTLGYSSFAQINVDFLQWGEAGRLGLVIAMVLATGIGSIVALTTAWTLADIALALMTILNLVCATMLGGWAFGALRDYDRQRKNGVAAPRFVATGNTDLPGELRTQVWGQPRTPVGS